MQISFVYNENKISGIVTAEPHQCVRPCIGGKNVQRVSEPKASKQKEQSK